MPEIHFFFGINLAKSLLNSNSKKNVATYSFLRVPLFATTSPSSNIQKHCPTHSPNMAQ
jgi:hypothetical protein